jgi:hypothetical protein
MKHYRLVYKQPFEYDDDSPSGIGDHGVAYHQEIATFDAPNVEEAKRTTSAFLKEGGLNFGHHVGSEAPGLYPRLFVSLEEIKPIVSCEISHQKYLEGQRVAK